jgi:error-prone DNA polymerase
MKGRLLLVKGILQKRDGVTHIVAGALFDHSSALDGLGVKSRDFH